MAFSLFPDAGGRLKTKARRLLSSRVDTSLYALPVESQFSRNQFYLLPYNNSFLWSVSKAFNLAFIGTITFFVCAHISSVHIPFRKIKMQENFALELLFLVPC